jgi:hypothetical protein
MTTAMFFADLVVAVHLAFLGYVLLGGFLGLRDVRWLLPHLLAVAWGVVGVESAHGCPLTSLEKWFIEQSGGVPYDGPFISHYLTGHLYPADAQDQVWLLCATIVLTSYVVVLVHHNRRRLAHHDDHRHASAM